MSDKPFGWSLTQGVLADHYTIDDYREMNKRLTAELAQARAEIEYWKGNEKCVRNLYNERCDERDALRARCERYEYRERIARSYMAYAEKYRCSCGADIDAELEMCKLRELFKEALAALAPSGGGGENG